MGTDEWYQLLTLMITWLTGSCGPCLCPVSQKIIASPEKRSAFRILFLLNRIPLLHHQFSSVAHLCPTFCDPIDCSMPGFPVLYHSKVNNHSVDPSLSWDKFKPEIRHSHLRVILLPGDTCQLWRLSRLPWKQCSGSLGWRGQGCFLQQAVLIHLLY